MKLRGGMKMLKPRCRAGTSIYHRDYSQGGRRGAAAPGPRAAGGGCPAPRPAPALAVTSPSGLCPPPPPAPPGASAPTVQQEPRSGWGRACLGIRSHYQWELKWTVNHLTPPGPFFISDYWEGEGGKYIYIYLYTARGKSKEILYRHVHRTG